MPSTAAPRLPQELVDCIIDQLHGDIRTLKLCSLVCKAWASSSARQLFRSFRPSCHFREEEEDVEESVSWTYHDFPACYEFLATSPRAARHVRSLELEPWMDSAPLMCPYIEDFATIMTLLPSVRDIYFYQCLPMVKNSLCPFVSRWDIREVRIRDEFDNARLVDLLTCFRRTENLEIINPRKDPPALGLRELPSPFVRTHLTHVHTLVIAWRGHAIALVRALQTSIDFATLEHVILHNSSHPPPFELFRHSACLKSLTYLVGSQPPTIPTPSRVCSVTLAGSLKFFFSSGLRNPHATWTNILRDLELISSNSRLVPAGVVLRMDLDYVCLIRGKADCLRSLTDALSGLDWAAFNNILGRLTLRDAFRITVQLESSLGARGQLGRDFPVCLHRLEEVINNSVRNGRRNLVEVSVVLGPELMD